MTVLGACLLLSLLTSCASSEKTKPAPFSTTPVSPKVLQQVKVSDKVLESCGIKTKRPESFTFGDSLQMWEKDRNTLDECSSKNEAKAKVIRQFLKTYQQK